MRVKAARLKTWCQTAGKLCSVTLSRKLWRVALQEPQSYSLIKSTHKSAMVLFNSHSHTVLYNVSCIIWTKPWLKTFCFSIWLFIQDFEFLWQYLLCVPRHLHTLVWQHSNGMIWLGNFQEVRMQITVLNSVRCDRSLHFNLMSVNRTCFILCYYF